jgi:acetyl esterase/lipase
MSFADLPTLPPMFHPEAAGYAQRICAGSRAAMRDCRTVLDCAYGPDYWNKLDVYLPPETARRGPWPVVCYWHGGAWSNGCKEWMGFMAPALVDAPAVFVSLSYRRAPQVRLPEMVADCFQGLHWVRSNIARHGGDPDRLYVGGHSAGAHLAALVALRPDLQQAHGIPAGAIRGCFPTSGTFDFRSFDAAAGGVEAQVLRNVLPRPQDAWAWSPLRTLEANRVPFYVTWGERDHARVVEQGRAFVAALDAFPGRARWDEVPGATHFTVNEDMGRRDSRWVRMVRSIITAKESP